MDPTILDALTVGERNVLADEQIGPSLDGFPSMERRLWHNNSRRPMWVG